MRDSARVLKPRSGAPRSANASPPRALARSIATNSGVRCQSNVLAGLPSTRSAKLQGMSATVRRRHVHGDALALRCFFLKTSCFLLARRRHAFRIKGWNCTSECSVVQRSYFASFRDAVFPGCASRLIDGRELSPFSPCILQYCAYMHV